MTPDSQCAAILAILKSGRSLTPLEALDEVGCFRLGARIFELRREGHPIEAELIQVGEGKRVARYSLRREAA